MQFGGNRQASLLSHQAIPRIFRGIWCLLLKVMAVRLTQHDPQWLLKILYELEYGVECPAGDGSTDIGESLSLTRLGLYRDHPSRRRGTKHRSGQVLEFGTQAIGLDDQRKL